MSANALDPVLWPASARRNLSGELEIGGMTASDLARRFGTPLYIYDEADARARATRVRHVLTVAAQRVGTTAQVYYAGKAFLCGAVARWVTEAGLKIDVCSGGELAVVLAAGVPADRVGFHGNNKNEIEIATAVQHGVGSIVLDSEIEVERVAAAATRANKVQQVRLRVKSGVHAGAHEYLATSHDDQKFGVTLAEAPALVRRIRSLPSLRFLGLHAHIGSQIFSAAAFALSARALLATHAVLLAEGHVPELNLGGGFGVAIAPGDDPEQLETIATEIVDAVVSECGRLRISVPSLVFEPGRAVIGPAAITLYTVGTVKSVQTDSGSRLYLSVDGGMSDNPRPALYGANYTVRVANREPAGEPTRVRVVGKHCETGDVVVLDDQLPSGVSVDDLLAVPGTGAYCVSLASNYNFLPRPAVISVVPGEASLLLRRETVADLLSRDESIAKDLS